MPTDCSLNIFLTQNLIRFSKANNWMYQRAFIPKLSRLHRSILRINQHSPDVSSSFSIDQRFVLLFDGEILDVARRMSCQLHKYENRK